MKLSQKELILAYVDQFGSILPAKISGIVFKGQMLGSESSKRCRELRAEGKLISKQEGKFEKFYRPLAIKLPPAFAPKKEQQAQLL